MNRLTMRQHDRLSKGRAPFSNGRCEGCGENCLDGKRFLVIVRQAFVNPNSGKTLLEEDQIECFGVKIYSCPRVFGGNKLIDVKDHVGRSVKLGISWYGSTRYLDIILPTREDIYRLGYL